jgi:hypothetical protein
LGERITPFDLIFLPARPPVKDFDEIVVAYLYSCSENSDGLWHA